MATPTIASPAAILQFPRVPADQISQAELAEFVGAQKTLENLQRHVDTLESNLLARLRSGATVEAGERSAEVKRGTRRSPSWKEIVKRLAGRLGMDAENYCRRVIAATKPTESFSLEVN
jgi:hypothetical protein